MDEGILTISVTDALKLVHKKNIKRSAMIAVKFAYRDNQKSSYAFIQPCLS